MQRYVLILLSLGGLLLSGCKKKEPPPPEMPPPPVSFIPATAETVNVTREYPGRIGSIRIAEVRARVSGILLHKTFNEGAEVKAGDALFKIDPLPLEAYQKSAAAALARAEATAKQAETQAVRARTLAVSKAASQQDLDTAEAALLVAQADVLSAQAALATATLNLGYATVTAPIAGRIGRAEVTEGALVGQGSATLLAVIQQLDPVHLDFTQPSAELLSLKRAMDKGELGRVSPEESAVTLLLEDGSEYEKKGRVLFSEVSVDETTGMVSLRAEFPNPNRLLLPGMFARVRFIAAIRENAITVPQRAVTRMQGGKGSVIVVDETDKAQMRMIETGEAIGDKWIVSSGLKAGERVIMEGHIKVLPGALVKPEPFVEKKEAQPPVAASPVEKH